MFMAPVGHEIQGYLSKRRHIWTYLLPMLQALQEVPNPYRDLAGG